jgi:transglutaminase-like putative cysteine protease
MPLHIRHETIYRYEEPVRHSVQTLKLTPRHEGRQRTLQWSMQTPGRRSGQIDAWGNMTHLLTLDEPHDEIRIIVSGIVDVDAGPLSQEPGLLSPLIYRTATPLTAPNAALDTLARVAQSTARVGTAHALPEPDLLLALAEAVCVAVRYRPGATTVTDTATTALARGEGVCQDQAHVFLAACRCLGVAARYVSGYLHAGDQGEIASHAWVDIWRGDAQGWLGLDVTHRRWVDARYCRLAVGRDYLDAAPVRGVRRGGGAETLEVRVHVGDSEQ